MDFTLSPEQLLIKDSATRFAAENRAPGDRWNTFAELGWLAIGAPDALGGFGGPVEIAILMEAFGRGLIAEPYAAQVVLAGTLLRRAGRADLLAELVEGRQRFAVAYEEPGARYDPAAVVTTAMREGPRYVVRGRKVRVLGAGTAQTIVVSARTPDGISLVALPAGTDGVVRRVFAAEDGHDVCDIELDGARVPEASIVGEAGAGLPVLECALDHAIAAICAEAVGVMSVMHELTLAYLKARTQFSTAIGSFQALQHRMADMFIALELARSMAYVAAMTLETETETDARKRGISAAKVQIARSGRFIGQNAIQLHGAIGMTEEYTVGHYFKRMTTIERLLGDIDYHLARYAETQRARQAVPTTA